MSVQDFIEALHLYTLLIVAGSMIGLAYALQFYIDQVVKEKSGRCIQFIHTTARSWYMHHMQHTEAYSSNAGGTLHSTLDHPFEV